MCSVCKLPGVIAHSDLATIVAVLRAAAPHEPITLEPVGRRGGHCIVHGGDTVAVLTRA